MTLSFWTASAIVLQGLGFWGAVDVVFRGRTAQGTTAWALALIFLPIVALPLYLVFGERRFQGYIRARRNGVRQIDQAAASFHEELRGLAAPPDGLLQEHTALSRLARLPFTWGNRPTLLIDGEATFDAIFRAIDGAADYVLVQFYIFRDDALGRRLETALCAARSRGVRVMLLYDEIGSYGLPREYLDRLRAAGCQCSGFRTKRRRQWSFRLNFRNHRKIVVVDGVRAFVGGHNVGIEYLGLDPGHGPWRDTHLELDGPSALCLQLAFLEDWYWANRTIPTLRWKPDVAADAESGASVLIVSSGPADSIDTCAMLYTQIANSATRRLWLATPYFVPDEQVLGAIQLAALRGVDVRLIVPERSDSQMVRFALLSFFEELLQVGVKVYRFESGFMHQKVALSDDLAVVSTANLDNRSFRINFEVGAVVADAEFAATMQRMLERDMEHSRLVTPEALNAMPWRIRFASRLCRLFAPIL